MAKTVKGPKKIRLKAGESYFPGTTNDSLVLIKADVATAFEVAEWFPETTEAQKNNITWLYEDVKRKKVLMAAKTGVPEIRALSIPKKLCGSSPMYYLEASLTGSIDLNLHAGILVRGVCEPLIVSSSWSKEYKGASLKDTPIRFGDDVHLRLFTEGLNGNRVTIQFFKMEWGDDLPVDTLNNILCENGEINLLIRHTFLWYPKLKTGPEVQKIYVKILDPLTQKLVLDDHKQDMHARFLRLQNAVSTSAVASPTNLTVATVGPPLENLKQVDHCRYTKIELMDPKAVPVFDEGKIDLEGAKNSEFYLDEKINYAFDEYKVRDSDKKKLDKIAEILMKIPYTPVELGSHTDRFGTPEYNMKLSEKRAKAAVDYLISKNIDASRIFPKGYGKTKLVNADENLSKQDSIVNRRTTIKLKIFTHNAVSIQYETIGPGESIKREIPIKISNFKTKGLCNLVSTPHKVEVPYGELLPAKASTTLKLDAAETIHPKVYSPLDERTHAYDYIWPMSRQANKFYYYINSCAYFSDQNKPTLVINTYSDIKWVLTFFLNLTNDLSVKWQNFTPEQHREMQSRAGKLGAERRWKQKEASFGFDLQSNWNMGGDGTYGGHDEFKKQHEGKFKKLYSLFSGLNSISDAITAQTKGTVRNIGFKNAPISFAVKPPNLSLSATWQLQRAKKEGASVPKIGTRIDINFNANPLIGLELTIDLIGTVVGLVAGAISGGSAAPGALKMYYKIKERLKSGLDLGNDDVGFKANVDFYMDLVITSMINTKIGFGFNTVSETKEDTFKLEATSTLGVELKAGVMIKGELSMLVVSVDGYFEVKAKGSASITFGHGVYYDSKGLMYKPKLGFDGLDAEYIITASVGLATKKGTAAADLVKDQKGNWVLAEGNYKEVIPKFDVIKSLEEISGISIQIPLMRGDDD